MSALTTLNIPVTVHTDQVAPAMKKVEKTVADSAARIGKIKAAVMPGLGALGAGPLGSVLGGVAGTGTIGMGIAGVGAAFMAPILAATKLQDALNAQTKGAAQAFEEYKKTGMQTAQLNSVLLQRLATLEKQQAGGQPMGFMAAFEQANISVANANIRTGVQSAEGIGGWWSKTGTEVGAFLGSVAGGADIQEAFMEAKLSTAGEGVARQTSAELEQYRRGNISQDDVRMMRPATSEQIDILYKQMKLQQELVRQGI
jgi:hypothetical protein